jgi:hypothetical protein
MDKDNRISEWRQADQRLTELEAQGSDVWLVWDNSEIEKQKAKRRMVCQPGCCERWRAVCVDQRHIYGFTARRGCSSADPPELPRSATGRGCSHAARSCNAEGLPITLVSQ